MTKSPIIAGGNATVSIAGGDVNTYTALFRITQHLHGPAPRAPAGLPAPPATFTGRDEELRELAALLNPSHKGATAVVVTAVAGMAGIGKTALALTAAHQAMENDRFAGGVFFLDLHGYTPDPDQRVTAGAAAAQLLRTMGVRDDDLPPTDPERLALYRSMLADYARAGRGILVVADNASATGQVEPLRPAQPCHQLLITSRHTLALPARLIDLAVLPEHHAVELLRTALAIAGPDPRPDAEPHALRQIAVLCGCLPLALQIIAALLRAEPAQTMASMASALDDARHRLALLDTGDLDENGRPIAAQAAFELSYHHLLTSSPEQARLFRLASLIPSDFGADTAAALTGQPEPVVRRHLAALTRAHLLTTPANKRWGMHDLLRLYADQRSHADAEHDGRDEAIDRLLAHYLTLADAADDHLRHLTGQPTPAHFTGRADALDWFDAERASLVAAVALAHTTGRHRIAADLPACLNIYLSWRRHLDDRLTVDTIALTASRELGDRHSEAHALNYLGLALRQVRRFEEAIGTHTQAAAIYRELGDRHGEAQALNNLGLALREVGRFEEAITAHQQDLDICCELGDRHGEGQALTNLGLALCQVRRFEEAITAYEQAIANFESLGDSHSVGIVKDNLERTRLQRDEQ